MKKIILCLLFVALLSFSCSERQNKTKEEDYMSADFPSVEDKVEKSKEEWKEELSPEVFHIMREKGTERPFSGKYYKFDEEGVYVCAACGNALFKSDTKFNSGSGWPSFYAPYSKERIETKEDLSGGMERTEVLCARCGGHLGHVFEDGPDPTGLRYCINSMVLDFIPADSL